MGGPETAIGGLGAKAIVDGAEGNDGLGQLADLFGAGPSFLVNRDPERAAVAGLSTLAAILGMNGLPVNMPSGAISQPTSINSPQRDDRRRRFGIF